MRTNDWNGTGQVAVLYDEVARRTLVVSNTHILFNPKRGDIKYRQQHATGNKHQAGKMQQAGAAPCTVPFAMP
jgi:hypothetical protein